TRAPRCAARRAARTPPLPAPTTNRSSSVSSAMARSLLGAMMRRSGTRRPAWGLAAATMRRMSSPIRVGIVGYGYATRTFHAPLVASVPGLELVAVSSSDAAKVHADWPGLAVEATPDALVARADVDLVVVPTPNATHHPLASAALRAGKHVVVDKPFTL